MSFFTRPNFEDRQHVQYSGTSITLSGFTNINNVGYLKINPQILDFTGTTTASTLYNISGAVGYINQGEITSFILEPPVSLISGSTGTTTVDVTGYVLTSLDAYGRVIWTQPVDISVSGFSYNNANKLTILNNDGSEFSVYLNEFSGLTVNGIVSATTYYGDGSNLTNIYNFYVTGGTIIGDTLTLNRQNGSVIITGFTTEFTGNTSGNCISNLYVENLNSCSPLHIQNISGGNVLIGENGGVSVGIGTGSPLSKFHLSGDALIQGDVNITGNVNIIGTATTINTETVQTRDNKILLNYSGTTLSAIGGGIEILSAKTDGNNVSLTTDIYGDWNSNTGLNITGRTNDSTSYGLNIQNSDGTSNFVVRNDGYVGIGTTSPSYLLHIVTGTSELIYEQSLGGRLMIIGDDLPRFDAAKIGVGGASFGIRASSDPTTVGYGKFSDTFIYASATSNGLNLINMVGGGEDYIRFYAGAQATSPPHVHIQGNGLTQGYVGIGTESPTQKLHVSGNTRLENTVNNDLSIVIANNNIGGTSTRSVLSQQVVSSSGGTTFSGIIATSGYETDLTGGGFSDSGTGYLKNALTIALGGNPPRGDINIGTRDSGKFLRFFSGNQNFNSTSLRGSLDSNGKWGFGTNMTGQTSTVDIMGNNGYNQLRLRTSYTPASSGDTNGNVGDVAWDNNYLYIKTVSGWGRTVLDYSF